MSEEEQQQTPIEEGTEEQQETQETQETPAESNEAETSTAEEASEAVAEEVKGEETSEKGAEGSSSSSSSSGKEVVIEGLEEEEEVRPPKKHVNIVFIGHVDAGKSTISGHLMYLTGMLDDRTLAKYEREAEAKNRATWKFAWAVDTTDQERAKGKTEECGRAYFETENKVFTILDAPGHKNFVPHMIGGASQADIGILVISARKGEFETGFENGGQTREHAMLAKTVGVKQLIVLVNKMDSVDYAKERFDEIVDGLKPFLRKTCGYSKKDMYFMPVSGMDGANLRDRFADGVCPWFEGPSFLELLDKMKPPERLYDVPLRLPVAEKYKDMGTLVMGKLESGVINLNDELVLMPNRVNVKVEALFLEDVEIKRAEPGDNVKLRLKGVDEENVHVGDVLCATADNSLVPTVRQFEAQFMILEYKSIISSGYQAVMHIHSEIVEIVLSQLLYKVDKKTGEKTEKRPKFAVEGETVLCRFQTEKAVCMETFKDFPQLGRFMIRDEGNTVGVGVVTRVRDKNKESIGSSGSSTKK